MVTGAWGIEHLRNSLTVVNELQKEAVRLGEPKGTLQLRRAAGEVCDALMGLSAPEGLLEDLQDRFHRVELRRVAQRVEAPTVEALRDCLNDPVLPRLLVQLDYEPPPTVEDLLRPVGQNLRLATELYNDRPDETFDAARQAIGELQEAVCELSHAGTWPLLWRALQIGTPILAGVLLADVVVPGTKEAIQAIAPHAVELIDDFWSRARHVTGLLSMSLVLTSGARAFYGYRELVSQGSDATPDATAPAKLNRTIPTVRSFRKAAPPPSEGTQQLDHRPAGSTLAPGRQVDEPTARDVARWITRRRVRNNPTDGPRRAY